MVGEVVVPETNARDLITSLDHQIIDETVYEVGGGQKALLKLCLLGAVLMCSRRCVVNCFEVVIFVELLKNMVGCRFI